MKNGKLIEIVHHSLKGNNRNISKISVKSLQGNGIFYVIQLLLFSLILKVFCNIKKYLYSQISFIKLRLIYKCVRSMQWKQLPRGVLKIIVSNC